MSTDIKLSKAQISKIIHSGWFLGSFLSKLAGPLKGVTKTIKNEAKEQKGGFLSMLLGTSRAILLGNLLSGKGTVRVGYGHPSKKWKGIVRAGYGHPT